MSERIPKRPPRRILLTSVFGPYGVDDAYGHKENKMELFHNQVTRVQGAASFRFTHRSFGLYFLAANVDADVTVLDFPSRQRFVEELAGGYDMVGISFITPNFKKAREMARLARAHAPRAEIVLGGHGAAIDRIEELIDCDDVVRGEGIGWLRRHLGQNPDAPIVHPTLPSAERQHILGVPVPGTAASLLVPGVGCVNGCNFCSTSHFFGRSYTPFLTSGRELFETACRIADERGTDQFFVMDENFLKHRDRALELLEQMERHQRWFRFHLFSSAEAVTSFGLDNLVRMGVTLMWVGFESHSRQDTYPKNTGIDAAQLVRDLRARGISVIASGMLCMEHHTPDNMRQDIDFLVDLEPDMVQFMLYTPLPVTALYRDHEARGLLRHDLPFEEWHGQKRLAYRHPAFDRGEPERWLDAAFRCDYERNSSSLYRVTETSLRGYEWLAAMPDRDACLEARKRQFEQQAREYAPVLPALRRHAVNALERRRCRDLERRVEATFGPPGAVERLKRLAMRGFAAWWNLRLSLLGDHVPQRTIVTRSPAGQRSRAPVTNLRPSPRPIS
jgi:hypothetical protein